MKKTIFVIVVLVLMLGCARKAEIAEQPEVIVSPEPPADLKCEDIHDESYCKELELLNQGECDSITNELLRKQCLSRESVLSAIESNDVSLCGQLENEAKINCEQSFYLEKAYGTADVSLCDNTVNVNLCKDSYYMRKAGEGDKSLCDNIKNEQLKAQCGDLYEG